MAFFIIKKQCVHKTELTVWQQILSSLLSLLRNPKKPNSVEKAWCGQLLQRGAGTAGEDENEAFKDSKLLGVPEKAVALHLINFGFLNEIFVTLCIEMFSWKYLSLNYSKFSELFLDVLYHFCGWYIYDFSQWNWILK